MTVETAPLLSESDARRLTQRISLLLDAAAGTLDKLAESIREARDGRADLAMGYNSWADYAAAEFGPHTAGLTATIRRELVATLSAEVDGSPALSTRQIAPAVGVTQQMVVKDRQVTTPVVTSPEPTTAPPFDPTTGEVLDDERGSTIATVSGVVIAEQRHVDVAAPVLGLDGKTYTRKQADAKPRRKSLPDALRTTAERLWSDSLDLRAALEDDRMAPNRASITEVTIARVRAAALNITDFTAALDLGSVVETEEARDQMAADLNHISETFARLARSLKEEPK